MIRVLVVDDQLLIRSAVREIVNREADLTVIGECADGQEAIEDAARLSPDVILMDIRMPRLDGIAATAAICGNPALSESRILILTTFEEDEFIVAALRAGASGFVGKGTDAEELIRAIRTVHRGEALLSPAATRALIDRFVVAGSASTSGDIASLDSLTEREVEILRLVGRGLSNQEIAADLVISPHTVKTHVNRTMSKLSAHDRAQLVVLAYEGGLVH
jgi:DNA-binding NarL/FixJ family response regulator